MRKIFKDSEFFINEISKDFTQEKPNGKFINELWFYVLLLLIMLLLLLGEFPWLIL